MTTKEKKKKSKAIVLKPASKDIYYEYVCPKCGCNHWINHKEACTKNFKIVCDCDITIRPKRIIDTKIVYAASKKPSSPAPVEPLENNEPPTDNKTEDVVENSSHQKEADINLDDHVLSEASKILVGYGYEDNEADDLIRKAFELEKQNDISILVKAVLKGIGVDHD
jgi:hypothetical protein